MTELDGRDGAHGLTLERVPINSELETALLDACKTALLILDTSFDGRISQLLTECICDFEVTAGMAVFQQEITASYQYFKGKNKLPYYPHIDITNIDALTTGGYTVTGLSEKYVDGGTNTANTLTIQYTAGYVIIPERIKAIIVKMVEFKFKNEVNNGTYPKWLELQIRSFNHWLE